MDDLKIPKIPNALPAIESETLKIGFKMKGSGESPRGHLFRFEARSGLGSRDREVREGSGSRQSPT